MFIEEISNNLNLSALKSVRPYMISYCMIDNIIRDTCQYSNISTKTGNNPELYQPVPQTPLSDIDVTTR